MAEAQPHTLLSEKLHKYGALGAGLITLDPSHALRHAESVKREEEAAKSGGYPTPSKPPRSAAPPPSGASKELTEAIVAMSKDLKNAGNYLKREHLIEVLEETARVQAVVQQEISTLARELADQKKEKKKRKPLTFPEGHKKILELNLPREPLEEHGIPENVFQNLLMQYQEDDEVMNHAARLLHPAGKGDPDRAKGITLERIVEIHTFMVEIMDKVLNEFRQLSKEARKEYTAKACETTAELLVSVAVEQQLSVRCEDVEQAVIMYDEALQQHPEFQRCTESLAHMMQLLVGCTQVRATKDEFVEVLKHLSESIKTAKVFAKKLHEDYRSKSVGIEEAYARFDDFTEKAHAAADDLPDLSNVEMMLCKEEYGDDSEVQRWWDQSGSEANIAMATMMTGATQPQAGGAKSSSLPEDSKRKKTKPSEIVEMQELMVDELKRICEATSVALKKGSKSQEYKIEVLAQMVQALASGAVERRYGVSAEEMTLMAFQHAAVLQRNERFVRATEKQQELLMSQLPKLCQAATAS